MMQVRWKSSFSASCLHAAASVTEGLPIADETLVAKLNPSIEVLTAELQTCGFSIETTFSLLTCLAADFENNRQLVEATTKRLQGTNAVGEAAIARLAGAIADLEATWLREQPTLAEELAVRGRPLREQWEARGPGLLRAITNLTDDCFVASAAEVVLVSPIVGGHGRAHLRNNRVTLEAVLTHPYPELPETLRLGWLLAQLNLDIPVYSEPVSQLHLPRLAGLATLPLVLAAAEAVELVQLNEANLARAIECWYLPPSLSNDAAQRLIAWWEAYVSGRTRWPVAMAALDQMLNS